MLFPMQNCLELTLRNPMNENQVKRVISSSCLPSRVILRLPAYSVEHLLAEFSRARVARAHGTGCKNHSDTSEGNDLFSFKRDTHNLHDTISSSIESEPHTGK